MPHAAQRLALRALNSGDVGESESRAIKMIERKNEVRQEVIAAVTARRSPEACTQRRRWTYQGVFIPGTVINGEDASGHTVSEWKRYSAI